MLILVVLVLVAVARVAHTGAAQGNNTTASSQEPTPASSPFRFADAKMSSRPLAGSGSVKGGVGVTDSEIKLGLMTDLSGIFAPLAIPLTDAQRAYWRGVNADGGVCGRKITLVIKDHGYDALTAVRQYKAISGRVAAFQQLLGSPMIAALLPYLESDNALAMVVSWSGSLLGNDHLIITGSTYELEQINALSYLMDKGKLKVGDKLGAVYLEGTYGESGVEGVKLFARDHGMTVVARKIQATDEDMAGPVAKLNRNGVNAISVTTSPTQFASVARRAMRLSLNVPIVANGPAYDPALLRLRAANAVKKLGIVADPTVAYNSHVREAVRARRSYERFAEHPLPKAAVMFGWAQAVHMRKVLQQACADRDLSRDGLIAASHELAPTDLDGLVGGKLDYSDGSQPPTRASFVFKPARVPGGLRQLGGPVRSDTAEKYLG